MKTSEIIFQYFQLFLGWPVIILILGIIFLKWFKEPISDFFRRLVKGEAYGVRIEASSPLGQQKEATQPPQLRTQDEIKEYVKENPERVIKEYARLLREYWFERIFNLIFGTQIELLEYLSKKGSDGDKYVNLTGFYTKFVMRAGSASYQIGDYFGFLKGMRLTEYAGEGSELSVKITPFGVDFLFYIKSQYGTAYKYRLF